MNPDKPTINLLHDNCRQLTVAIDRLCAASDFVNDAYCGIEARKLSCEDLVESLCEYRVKINTEIFAMIVEIDKERRSVENEILKRTQQEADE